MQYWNWVTGYIVISIINAISFRGLDSPILFIITGFLCLLYLLAFFLWPYMATKEESEEMKKVAECYKKEEITAQDNVDKKNEGWEVVKIYDDVSDSEIFKKDKQKLDSADIASRSKSSLGITTISVAGANFIAACEILGIDAPEIENPHSA